MELRHYQSDIIAQVKDRDIVTLPTGTGKSAVIVNLAKQFQQTGRVVIVVPTVELRYQTQENLKLWNCPLKNVTVSVWLSAESLEADYWLHDECHHSASPSWQRLLTKTGQHIGFSATPARLDGKPLDGFRRVLEPYPLQYFMSNGYLCNNISEYTIDLGCNLSDTTDDLDGQFQHLNNRVVYARILDEYVKRATPTTKAIVFAVTIKHCYYIAKYFYDAGYRVAVIHSELPNDQREHILKQFRRGHVRILINVAILTEGVDIPDADMLLMCRRTSSRPLYFQMVGRVLRPKSRAVILDYVGNLTLHGSVKSCTGWLEEFQRDLTRKQDEQNKVLVCSKCGTVKTFGQPCLECGAESDKMVRPSQLPRELDHQLSEYILSPYQQVLAKLSRSDAGNREYITAKLIKARAMMTGLNDAMLLQQFLENRYSERLANKIYRTVMGD